MYCQGNLLYSPDGTHLFSPVGNRVTVFNLVEYVFAPKRNKSRKKGKFLITAPETSHIPSHLRIAKTLPASASRPAATSSSQSTKMATPS